MNGVGARPKFQLRWGLAAMFTAGAIERSEIKVK